MAREFNGTSDVATVTVDLSGAAAVQVSAWLYRSASPGGRLIWEYGATFGFDLVSNGPTDLIRSYDAVNSFTDNYVIPSLNAWHHYLWIMSAASFNRVIIDGEDVALFPVTRTSGPHVWGNNLLTIGGRAASNFMPCRVAEFALWNGVASTSPVGPPKDTARGLYAGWTAPCLFDVPTIYIPMLGDNPEPDYMGGKHSAVLTGTTLANHAPTKTLLMPCAS